MASKSKSKPTQYIVWKHDQSGKLEVFRLTLPGGWRMTYGGVTPANHNLALRLYEGTQLKAVLVGVSQVISTEVKCELAAEYAALEKLTGAVEGMLL